MPRLHALTNSLTWVTILLIGGHSRQLSRGSWQHVSKGCCRPAQGWQHEASIAVETTFMEVSILSQLVPAERAMLHSQGGPLAGLPLTAVPVHLHVRFDSDLFRVLLLRRLRLPLPLSSRTCRCGRPLDCLGHHRASCSRAGVLGRRLCTGVCSGSHLQRSWRERRLLEDLDLLGISIQDQRRIEVIAEGLPAWNGAQLAIDTTLVSPLRADGEPHRWCADEGGVALVAARRRKTLALSFQARKDAPSWWFLLARSAGASQRRRTPSFAPSPEPRFDPSPNLCALGLGSLGCIHVGMCCFPRVRIVPSRSSRPSWRG